MKTPVMIKHHKYGIALSLRDDIEFSALLEEIRKKFQETARFFGNAEMTITFEGRSLSREEEDQIIDVIEQNSQIRILMVFLEDEKRDGLFVRAREILRERMTPPPPDPCTSEYYTFAGTVRKGDIFHTSHNLLILGDVEEEASVASEQNIIIMGKASGILCAGAQPQARARQNMSLSDTQSLPAEVAAGPLQQLDDLASENQGNGAGHFIACSDLAASKIIVDGYRYMGKLPKKRFGRALHAAVYFDDDQLTVKEISPETLSALSHSDGLNLE